MSVNAALAKPGCGCGGSGGGNSGCGCGGGVASANLAATAFVRPRFFAGQLLTEDDLTALTDYTTAKNRLHNRYLFGAGVVCGLWVNCDPCGGSTVTVQPGYALDCCGNDLILRCAATLDVNAMIRDLLATQLGKDCGDPCADQGTSSSKSQGTAATRHYRLYARYGEQETDPVAPYATGDQCGPVSCEPTRIREGISFVLKCPAKASPPDDLPSRLRACQPDQGVLRRQVRLKEYGGPMAAAMRMAERPPAFGPEEADDLLSLRAGLAAAHSAGDEDEVRSAIEHVRKMAALVARYDLAHDPPDLPDLTEARAELGAAAAALAAGAATAGNDPADRSAVDALLDQAARLPGQGPGLPRLQLAMLAQGLPLNQSVLEAVGSDAAALQEWLLDHLDNNPDLADCQLRSQVGAVSLTTAAGEEETAKVRSLGRAGSELADLFARIMQDCVCAAVNPPCAPCDDTDVPLACLEVADCTVVRICNAERDYVLSGTTLRYWYPSSLPPERRECSCSCGEPGRDVPGAEGRGLAFAETGVSAGEQSAAPVAPEAASEATVSEGAASEETDDATAQRLGALEQRVAELAEQLMQPQASLSALGGESPAKATKPTPRQADTPRRRRTTRKPAEAPGPADAQPDISAGTAGSDAPEGSDDS